MENKSELFYQVLRSRRSVRQYTDKEIPREALDRILETGRLSPSAANGQPWSFIAVTKEHPKWAELHEVFYKDGFRKAPVVIAACAQPSKAWVRKEDSSNYAWVDVAIAVTEMILAATAEGIGTCWVASFDLARARKILNVPDGTEIVTLLTLGYPTEPLDIRKKDRKPMDQILHTGGW
ncbi:MAG: nitroreductase family protein [Nitrospinae bacterium]|nr:nitroreductase family protein [Nitrospinota bacterium]